jgi:hypothetical protein
MLMRRRRQLALTEVINYLYLRGRPCERVNAARDAALDRDGLPRRRAEVRACRDNAECDALPRGSRFKARSLARDLRADGLRPAEVRPLW